MIIFIRTVCQSAALELLVSFKIIIILSLTVVVTVVSIADIDSQIDHLRLPLIMISGTGVVFLPVVQFWSSLCGVLKVAVTMLASTFKASQQLCSRSSIRLPAVMGPLRLTAMKNGEASPE